MSEMTMRPETGVTDVSLVRGAARRGARAARLDRRGGSFCEPADLYAELRTCAAMLREELIASGDAPLGRWCRWADDFISGEVNGSRAGVESINAHLEALAHAAGSRRQRLATAAEAVARAVFDAVTREEESARRHARTARQLLG